MTEQDIKENVAILAERHPELEWVLLDDGYQAFMGDWLTPSQKFPSGIEQVIADIRAQGKKPAIWLALLSRKRIRQFFVSTQTGL